MAAQMAASMAPRSVDLTDAMTAVSMAALSVQKMAVSSVNWRADQLVDSMVFESVGPRVVLLGNRLVASMEQYLVARMAA